MKNIKVVKILHFKCTLVIGIAKGTVIARNNQRSNIKVTSYFVR